MCKAHMRGAHASMCGGCTHKVHVVGACTSNLIGCDGEL